MRNNTVYLEINLFNGGYKRAFLQISHKIYQLFPIFHTFVSSIHWPAKNFRLDKIRRTAFKFRDLDFG